MLILEIAAGIVLALVVLAFWPLIIAGGAIVALLALLLAVVPDPSRAAKLARDRERQETSIRDATARELACAVRPHITEAQASKILRETGPVKATILNPECVLDGPVVPAKTSTSPVAMPTR